MQSGRRGIFRPVLGWLVVSSLLLLWQYHRSQSGQASIRFTVAMEGRDGELSHESTLNGLPYQTGSPCGVGWKRVVVRADNTEPFETNCFVWYDGMEFGKITLPHSRGGINLEIFPAVATVRIAGREQVTILTNITQQSVSLLTGQYIVEAKFDHFSTKQTVEVDRDRTNRVIIAPILTTLNLSSDEVAAEFELTSTNSPVVAVKGKTPTTIPSLPVGDYDLTLSSGDHTLKVPVKLIAPNGTNRLNVAFTYSAVSILSNPEGATISHMGKDIGTTPADFDVRAGSHQFVIAKDGYFSTNLDLTVSGTNSSTASVNLQITPGEKAIRDLRTKVECEKHLQAARRLWRYDDYSNALLEVDAALKIDSHYEDALTLKAALLKAQNNTPTASTQTEASPAESRHEQAQQLLQAKSSRLPDHELFDAEVLRCAGKAIAVRRVILGNLKDSPLWKIDHLDSIGLATFVISANANDTGWKQDAVIVIDQHTDNEVAIHFKLIALVAGENGRFIPLHPNFTSDNKDAFRAQLAKETQLFRKTIREGLP